MAKLLAVGLRPKWRSSFLVHVYTAYVSVGDGLKSLFLCGPPMGKLLVVGLGQKWRSSFSRTCLYSVCKCGRRPKITISMYGLPMGKLLVAGLRPKWRSSFFRICLCSVCECGKQHEIAISVWTFYGEIIGNRVKIKIAIEVFPYTPIQRMRVC